MEGNLNIIATTLAPMAGIAYLLAVFIASLDHFIHTESCHTRIRDAAQVIDCLGTMDWWYGWMWWATAGWGL